jgi:hypothetical protein
MNRTLLSCILGLFSFFAFFGGAELFGVSAYASIQETVGGCVVLILYLVVCQCLLPRDPAADAAEDWRARGCMVAPLLPFAVLISVGKPPAAILGQTVPMLGAGCIGGLAGGLLARALSRSGRARDAAYLESISKTLAQAGTALYLAVSVILVVMPAFARDTSRAARPGQAEGGMIVGTALHVLFAGVMFWRIHKPKTPVLPAAFGLLMGLLFVVVGVAQGPTMRLAAIASFACAAIDLLVCGWCIGVAIQRNKASELLQVHQ